MALKIDLPLASPTAMRHETSLADGIPTATLVTYEGKPGREISLEPHERTEPGEQGRLATGDFEFLGGGRNK